MRPSVTLTGYINSAIISERITLKNKETEPITVCKLQVACYSHIDKSTNKRVYYYFFCQAYGKMAEFIRDNFIKGTKVFIKGSFIQNTYIDKKHINDSTLTEEENKKRARRTINTIIIEHIEFMSSPKNEEYKNEQKDEDNIEEALNNEDNLKGFEKIDIEDDILS